MYFSSLYLGRARSSQTKPCCLSSIFWRFRLFVRNWFLVLYDTNLALIGRGLFLFLLICPGRCILCATFGWRLISSSSAGETKIFYPSSLSTSNIISESIFSSYALLLSVKLKNSSVYFLKQLIAQLYFFFFKQTQLVFMFMYLGCLPFFVGDQLVCSISHACFWWLVKDFFIWSWCLFAVISLVGCFFIMW